MRLADGQTKRADLLITGADGHRHAAGVTVTHAYTGNSVQAAEQAHADKVRAYRATIDMPYLLCGDEVVPLVHVAGRMLNERAYLLVDLMAWHLTNKLSIQQRMSLLAAKYFGRIHIFGRMGLQFASQETRVLRFAGYLA